jgi:serine/threonine protein kinase
VLEYHEYDLVGLLSCTSGELPLSHIRWYLRQAAEAIHQCHANGLMHRDVKAANMLVNRDAELRLADFGLMTTFDDPHVQHSHNVVTLWYRAPEILLGDALYGPAVDLWALGCLMVELFTKSSPFPGQNDSHQLELILRTCGTPSEDTYPGVKRTPGYQKLVSKWPVHNSTLLERFRSFPPEALDLLSGLLVLDPRRRLRAQEVLRHPFFSASSSSPPPLPSRVESLHEFELRAKRKLTSEPSTAATSGKPATAALGEKKPRLDGLSPSVQLARKPPVVSASSPAPRLPSAAGSSPPNPLTTSTFSPGPSPAGGARRPSPPGSQYAALAPLPVPPNHIRNPYLLPPRKRADAAV